MADTKVSAFAELTALDLDDLLPVIDDPTGTPLQKHMKARQVLSKSTWKNSVVAASTANGTLATAYENGDTLDGVTLATGDRILLKDQTSGDENGIYTVEASGAPTRAVDMDAADEVVAAMVFVEEGTTNAATAWKNTNTGAITLETTSLTFTAFGAGGSGNVTTKVSTADLVKTTDTALEDITGLVIALAADTRYWVRCLLIVEYHTTPEFTFGWSNTGGGTWTMDWNVQFVQANVKAFSGTYDATGGPSSTNTRMFEFVGSLLTDASAGNLSAQFAQLASNAISSTAKTGSWLQIAIAN